MSFSPSVLAEDLFNVRDIVAVVTGGGTGIGLMAAQALEANGAKAVYIVGRRLEVLEKAAKTGKYNNIIPFQGDVTSRSDMKTLVSRLEKEQGRLDVLIHCAGVLSPNHEGLKVPEDGSVESIQDAFLFEHERQWSDQFAVNVTAVYFLTAACLGLLKKGSEFWKNEEKKFVNKQHNVDNQQAEEHIGGGDQAEGAGVDDGKFLPRTSQVIGLVGISAYSRFMGSCMGYVASKAAVLQMMKTMATTFAPTDIRFNTISPGIFPTEITAGRGHLDDRNRNFLGPISRSQVPLGRPGNAQDIAGAVLYLCGRGGFYCNGATLLVDGGRIGLFPSSY